MLEYKEKANEYFINLLSKIEEVNNDFFNLLTNVSVTSYYNFLDKRAKELRELREKLNIDFRRGVTRLVIICEDGLGAEFVLKIPFVGPDCCKEEINIYNSIWKHHNYYVDYFAECWYGGDYKGVPIYIMRRADVDRDYIESFQSNRNYEETEGFCGETDVYECFASYYGEEETERLNDFLIDYDIEDIHSGNVGFVEGKPIFIDYCGLL